MNIEFENLDVILKRLGENGAFLTVKSNDLINTMTISWGHIGIQWNKLIFTVLVRNTRHTYNLIENSEDFTVSIPKDDSLKQALLTCGTKSGKDIDKFKECSLELKCSDLVNTPVIDNGGYTFECKILYKLPFDLETMNENLRNSIYKDNDPHTLYFGEIVKTYEL